MRRMHASFIGFVSTFVTTMTHAGTARNYHANSIVRYAKAQHSESHSRIFEDRSFSQQH
jgi:hypothetical protein